MKWPRKILSQGSQTLTLIHQVLTDNISMDDGQLTVLIGHQQPDYIIAGVYIPIYPDGGSPHWSVH